MILIGGEMVTDCRVMHNHWFSFCHTYLPTNTNSTDDPNKKPALSSQRGREGACCKTNSSTLAQLEDTSICASQERFDFTLTSLKPGIQAVHYGGVKEG